MLFAPILLQQATVMLWNWSFLTDEDPKANPVHRNSEGKKCYDSVMFGRWEIINDCLCGLSNVPVCSDESGKSGDI